MAKTSKKESWVPTITVVVGFVVAAVKAYEHFSEMNKKED